MTARHFYRCSDCLGVFTTAEELRPLPGANHAYGSRGTCGACGGCIEYMGRAHRDRLIKDELRCACDMRCTSARGPSCDCRCGGENHGSGLMVMVAVDAGGVPVAKMPEESQRRREAKEYRDLAAAALEAIKAKYQRILDRKNIEREYITGEEFAMYRRGGDLKKNWREAVAMRSHHARNKKLRAIIAELGATDPTVKAPEPPADPLTGPVVTFRQTQVSLFA